MPSSSLSRLRTIKDPERRAQASAVELARREAVVADVRVVRDAAVAEMLAATDAAGRFRYRPVDVATAIGVTRAAVAKRFTRAAARHPQ